MALDRSAALRQERDDLLTFCRSLSPEEWAAPSACAGWTIQDVVAHLGGIAHNVFTPKMIKFFTTKALERVNDDDVEARRSRTSEEVLAEYEKWSARMGKLLSVSQHAPLAKAPFRVGELGVYPMAMVASAAVFDSHLHLHYDMAPALGKTPPPQHPVSVGVVNEWVLNGIPKMCREQLSFMDRPVTITLEGPGGSSTALLPGAGGKPGRIQPAPVAGSAAEIRAVATEFALWATKRKPWRDQDVKIDGDEAYASRILDAIRVV